MTKPSLKTFILISTFALTACLEAQPEPELKETSLSRFNVQTITESLNTPWSVSQLPDESYLVTEKRGALKHIFPNGEVRNISGLPDNIYTHQQAGVFDVIPDSGFESNGRVYISYAYGSNDENGTAVIKARLENETLVNSEVIFRSMAKDTGSHFGGRLILMQDGALLLTLGDGFTYREAAQNISSQYGKIVRFLPNGQPHPENPFIENKNADPYIYSYGHRNVQGAALDTSTGHLWTHEHGPRGGDELNLIKPGKNYGWPLATTGLDYNGAKITPHKTYPNTEPFVHDWVPSIAPSGLAIYRGSKFPDWQGDALIGALAKKSLRRVDLENGKSIGEEILLSDINARIRDVRLGIDGAILIVTNTKSDEEDGGGQLLRILPK